jgi:flavin-dependent dehydrogenase
VGVEWLLQVNPEQWQPWADRLSFLMGSTWVPQGYGWVFPMQPGVLKLGVCRLLDPDRAQPALNPLLAGLLQRLGLSQAQVLENVRTIKQVNASGRNRQTFYDITVKHVRRKPPVWPRRNKGTSQGEFFQA